MGSLHPRPRDQPGRARDIQGALHWSWPLVASRACWRGAATGNLLMITILHSVVLGIVLSVSSAGTLEQDKDYEALVKVLTLGDPDSAAIAMHRLTVTNVRQMFAVDRELLELKKTVPDLDARVSEQRRQFDPQHRAGSVAVELDAKVYGAMPEIAQILQRQKISGREPWPVAPISDPRAAQLMPISNDPIDVSSVTLIRIRSSDQRERQVSRWPTAALSL